MLKVKDVKKKFGSKKVLQGVNFQAQDGKITVLCGPNGAGKTTLIRIILKLMKQDEGEIRISTNLKNIGFVFHKDILFTDITLKENLLFFTKVKQKQINKEILNKYLDLFNLKDDYNTKLSKYSSGMKRKGELLRVILEEPEFMILDEPTANLDPLVKVEIRELLMKLNSEKDITIFMTSHNLDEVEKIGDKILILNAGKIVWEGDKKILENEKIDLEKKFLEIVRGGENG